MLYEVHRLNLLTQSILKDAVDKQSKDTQVSTKIRINIHVCANQDKNH